MLYRHINKNTCLTMRRVAQVARLRGTCVPAAQEVIAGRSALPSEKYHTPRRWPNHSMWRRGQKL